MVKNETTVTETTCSPRGAFLDAWSDSEWNAGVQIDQIDEATTLAVQTRNNLYEITIVNGRTGDVLVRGGEFFPVRTPVRLEGSTYGGSILKRRGIYVGLRMEIVPQPVEHVNRAEYDPTGKKEVLLGHKVIRTSSIQSIGIVRRNPRLRQSDEAWGPRLYTQCPCHRYRSAPALRYWEMLAHHRWIHFPVGTRRFSSSNQLSTTLICVGADCVCSVGLSIRKRCPSGATS